MVYSTRRFVLSLAMWYFVVFFRPFSIAITSLGEERDNLSAFRMFVRFVWFCLFPLPLGVWEGLWLVIVAPLDFSLTFSAWSQRCSSYGSSEYTLPGIIVLQELSLRLSIFHFR